MSARNPAHVRRAELVAEQSKALTRALNDHDVEQGELAEAVGRAADKVQRVCDSRQRETASVVDVRMAREAGGSLLDLALELVRWQLGDRFAIARVAADANVEDDLHALAELVAQSGELAGHFAGAVADGRITADEATLGVAHCSVLIETLCALRDRLGQARADRGDNVRRQDSARSPQPSPPLRS